MIVTSVYVAIILQSRILYPVLWKALAQKDQLLNQRWFQRYFVSHDLLSVESLANQGR